MHGAAMFTRGSCGSGWIESDAGDPGAMDSFTFPIRRLRVRRADPIGYLARRSASLLVIVGAAAGLLASAVLDAVGSPTIGSLAAGVLVFVAAAALAAALPTRVGRAGPTDDVPPAAHPMQLGPDREQVIGRGAGAKA
jgi:hypothetical protein